MATESLMTPSISVREALLAIRQLDALFNNTNETNSHYVICVNSILKHGPHAGCRKVGSTRQQKPMCDQLPMLQSLVIHVSQVRRREDIQGKLKQR